MYYKRFITGNGETLPFVGCYQLPIWVTLLVLTRYIWQSERDRCTYQIVGDGGIYGPGDDEADGVLSRLAQDGGDLLGAHAPQPHVPDGQQVVAILQAPVLQCKEIEKRER